MHADAPEITESSDHVADRDGGRHRRQAGVVAVVATGMAAVVAVGLGVASAVAGGRPAGEGAGIQSNVVTAVSTAAVAAAPAGPGHCPAGQLPGLELARFPDGKAAGAPNPEAGLRAIRPGAEPIIVEHAWGNGRGAPVWLQVGGATFVANQLGDGTWFVSPATFTGCRAPGDLGSMPRSTGAPLNQAGTASAG